MIFLDSTRNAVALKEAYNKNIPTIAIVNASKDMSQVCCTVCTHRPSWRPVFEMPLVMCLANAQLQTPCPALLLSVNMYSSSSSGIGGFCFAGSFLQDCRQG